MDALSTPTYVQVKRLLFGGPGVAGLDEARQRASEAVEILQGVLVHCPEEAESLMDVSRALKRDLAHGVQAVARVPESEVLAGQMALGLATTAIMLGTIDALLWEATGRIPLSVRADGPVAQNMAEDLNLLRSSVSSPDLPGLERACACVRSGVPALMAEGGLSRTIRSFQEMLRNALARSWMMGFGEGRMLTRR